MPVTYALEDHVARITFDDGKANAITPAVLAELEDALSRAVFDGDAHAVLLVGRPERFSAGFDLGIMTGSAEGMRDLVTSGGRFMARLLLHPTPVVAACTGHALAAGALLLLASDVRIGADGPWKIGLNEVAIGMPLPTWAVELARYRMPAGEFDKIILGQVGGPADAVKAGFLDAVVPASGVLRDAEAMAVQLAKLSGGAVAGTKTRARQEVARRMLEGIDEDLAALTGPS